MYGYATFVWPEDWSCYYYKNNPSFMDDLEKSCIRTCNYWFTNPASSLSACSDCLQTCLSCCHDLRRSSEAALDACCSKYDGGGGGGSQPTAYSPYQTTIGQPDGSYDDQNLDPWFAAFKAVFVAIGEFLGNEEYPHLGPDPIEPGEPPKEGGRVPPPPRRVPPRGEEAPPGIRLLNIWMSADVL